VIAKALQHQEEKMNNGISNLRIAVVEDEQDMGSMICDMLDQPRVQVDGYLCGKSFLASKRLADYDAIVLDLSLPDVDGMDVMQRLAKSKPGASLVIITGHEQLVIDAARAVAQGLGFAVLAGLRKPFNRAQLLGALNLPAHVQ